MTVLGIDISTDHIRLTEKETVLFDEPGFLAYDSMNQANAIGWQALDQIGQSRVVSLTNKKTISDYLEFLFQEKSVFKLFRRTDVFICFPTSYSQQTCEEICQFVVKQGAREVIYDQSVWCTALASNLPIHFPSAQCLCIINKKEATIAVLANGTIRCQNNCTVTGQHIEERLRSWIQQTYKIQITHQTLDSILEQIGQVNEQNSPLRMQIHGIETKTQRMQTVLLDENQVAGALSGISYEWANWIYSFLNTLDPATQQQIAQAGITCCGQTMTLNGLGSFLQSQLHIPFQLLQPADRLSLFGVQMILKQMEDGTLYEEG